MFEMSCDGAAMPYKTLIEHLLKQQLKGHFLHGYASTPKRGQGDFCQFQRDGGALTTKVSTLQFVV